MKFPRPWRNNKAAAPAQANGGGGTPIDSTAPGLALSLDRLNLDMLREYTRSIYLWRCVDMIAQMASSVELEVEPHSNRPLNNSESQVDALIKRPNPQWTCAALSYFVCASLAVANKAYLLRVRGAHKETLELWPINANEITIQYAAGTKVIEAFMWYGLVGAPRQIIYPVDPETGDCDIIYIHRPFLNIRSDKSPAAVAAAPAEVFTRILQRCADIVNNSSNITGLLSTDAELGQKAVQEIKQRLDQYRTGSSESGGTLVSANAKWAMTRLSEDPSAALSVEIKDSLARDVAMTFGVPTQLVGLPGQDTYNNLAMARVGFMTDTVLPGYISLYVAALNHALLYGMSASIEPDIDGLPAMSAARLQLVETAGKATMLSVNEQRKILGYPPYEGDSTADKPVLLEELERLRLQVELQYGPGSPDNGAPT